MTTKRIAANDANVREFDPSPIRAIRGFLLCLVFLPLIGCSSKSANEVVIYCSVDQMHAEPILKEFEKRSGIRVKAVYDSEAVKSVGLVNRIRAEAKNPQADVFWNNEPVRSVQLANEGLLSEPLLFAARARVLVYSPRLVQINEAPRSIFDLTNSVWRGKVAMAYPLFGTTATHAAALFAVLGEEKAKAYYEALKANDVRLFEGNSIACEQVAQGHCSVGITDTDDFWERKGKGHMIEAVYPDDGLLIPNAISTLRNAPHPEAAKKLVEFLHSREVEQKLAFGPSRQIPMLGDDIPVPDGMRKLGELKSMAVAADKQAAALPAAMACLEKLFSR